MDLPLSVLSQVTAILEQQNISYVLVGSFASSIHGMYRSTADIDILADIHTEQIRPLFDVLKQSFYLDEQLRWYRAGNETSNTQWNDVLGVLGTSHSSVDLEYLHTWAGKLGIEDLLQKALDEVQEESD